MYILQIFSFTVIIIFCGFNLIIWESDEWLFGFRWQMIYNLLLNFSNFHNTNTQNKGSENALTFFDLCFPVGMFQKTTI